MILRIGMDKFHIFPLMEKTQILSNIEKCQSLTTSSLTCTKSLQKTCFCDYLGIPPFSKKTCPLKTRYVQMYNSFEKKILLEDTSGNQKIYKSTRLGLRFFSFSFFFMFEVFSKWEKFSKSKNRDL